MLIHDSLLSADSTLLASLVWTVLMQAALLDIDGVEAVHVLKPKLKQRCSKVYIRELVSTA